MSIMGVMETVVVEIRLLVLYCCDGVVGHFIPGFPSLVTSLIGSKERLIIIDQRASIFQDA